MAELVEEASSVVSLDGHGNGRSLAEEEEGHARAKIALIHVGKI